MAKVYIWKSSFVAPASRVAPGSRRLSGGRPAHRKGRCLARAVEDTAALQNPVVLPDVGRSGRLTSCIPHLPSSCQACGQPLRQVCGQDAFLSLLQIVGRAAKGNNSGGGVVYRKCRPPIPVARLADRAGIDHVPHAFFERELCRFRLAHGVVKRAEIIAGDVVGGETSLQMSMPEKCERGWWKSAAVRSRPAG